MYSILHDMNWVLPLRNDLATNIFYGFTFLGYAPFFLIFLPIGYWLWDRDMFTRLVVLIGLTAVLNGWLKDFWQDPRPAARFQLDADRVADSYGRPSGHAQVAVAMWFWLAWEMRRPWAWAAAAFIASGVIFSRLYLGVHDIDDVLAGTILGFITLGIFAWLVSERVIAFIRSLPAGFEFAVIIVSIPALWIIWPNGENPAPIASVLFLLLGWFAGAALDKKAAPHKPVLPAWWLQIVMAIGGTLGLFALRAGATKLVVATDLGHPVAGLAVSALLGFYATGIAPWIFRKLGLMKPGASHAKA
ncbi:phosphatase PAP2 family protein [Parvibaculum sp.]|uniref:phosphatase PAP2 family protein n=1 Tax=Parvibaculum sp. TaxID=2024848 RepID=UPI000C92720B|nr:phosphatase PAP2 family protein [Parvibaculum sp.]MAB14384.1 hypothetical protein [Parvibaculum sp.]